MSHEMLALHHQADLIMENSTSSQSFLSNQAHRHGHKATPVLLCLYHEVGSLNKFSEFPVDTSIRLTSICPTLST